MEVNKLVIDYSKTNYTIEEYLELEEASTEKHEYFQGRIRPLHGPRPEIPDICCIENSG